MTKPVTVVEPTFQTVLAAYQLQTETRDDGTKVIDFGTIEVDNNQDVDQLEAYGLGRFDKRVTAENFPSEKQGKIMVPLKLVNMGKSAQMPAIVSAIKQHAPRGGNIFELLVIHKRFPELAKWLFIVALESQVTDHHGNPLVSVLYRYGDRCGVCLYCCREGWSHDFDIWFVAAG